MIQTFLTHKDIVDEQPSLQERLQQGQISFTDIIAKSYSELLLDIKNKGYNLRKLGIPLVLLDTTTIIPTNTENTYTSEASVEDFVNVGRVIVELNSKVVDNGFTIQGSDDKVSWTNVATLNLVSLGTHSVLLNDFYRFYRVIISDIAGTSSPLVVPNCKVTIIETLYFYLHLYKTVANIYSTLGRRVSDFWEAKMVEYIDKYNYLLNAGLFIVDIDDDKMLNEADSKIDSRIISIRL